MEPLFSEENICIFVANLPSSLNNADINERLRTIFSRFGKILSVKTSRDKKNRPFAFVQFEGPAIDFLLTEIVMIEDRILRFEKAKSPSIPDKPITTEECGKGDKSVAVPEQFSPVFYPMQCAQPHLTIPLNDPINHGYSLFSPQIFPVYPSAPYPISYSCDTEAVNLFDDEAHKVYVSRLNGEVVTQRKLLRHFQQYGHITDIELFKNNLDGSLRQDAFAFISYLKPEQMLNAIRIENGREWLGRRLKCCRALKKREKSDKSMTPSTESDIIGNSIEADIDCDIEVVTGNI